jgi:hypothetical protein
MKNIKAEVVWSVLLALVIFAVVSKLVLDKWLDKLPHYEEMLER